MLTAPRPPTSSEQGAALHLWQSVFETPPGYFERYFTVDSQYQVGDTLGVWDGDLLVSAVHLCRRIVAWGASSLLRSGIANVATLPDYRKQGLSRLILREIIAKMEQEGFNYSLLGTHTHGHYAALSWERAGRPQATLKFRSGQIASEYLPQIFSRCTRPLPAPCNFRVTPSFSTAGSIGNGKTKTPFTVHSMTEAISFCHSLTASARRFRCSNGEREMKKPITSFSRQPLPLPNRKAIPNFGWKPGRNISASKI